MRYQSNARPIIRRLRRREALQSANPRVALRLPSLTPQALAAGLAAVLIALPAHFSVVPGLAEAHRLRATVLFASWNTDLETAAGREGLEPLELGER